MIHHEISSLAIVRQDTLIIAFRTFVSFSLLFDLYHFFFNIWQVGGLSAEVIRQSSEHAENIHTLSERVDSISEYSSRVHSRNIVKKNNKDEEINQN